MNDLRYKIQGTRYKAQGKRYKTQVTRRKTSYLVSCVSYLWLLLSACGGEHSDAVLLTGEIEGLRDDTIYIYGTDNFYDRIDTLVVTDGKFSATLGVDTLVAVWLQFAHGERYPLFLDKGDKIKVRGKADSLAVSGSALNEELTAYHVRLRELYNPSDELLADSAEAFIKSHPNSLASIYLLEKYLVMTPQPDFTRIKRLTERMTGELKDRPTVNSLLEFLEEVEKTDVRKSAILFSLPNAKGKQISRSDFKDKYLLIHFWASWDSLSREANAKLRPIYKKAAKSEVFALWGISLDVDRKEWETTVKRDTLKWEQSCDFAGWNTLPVKQYAIQSLPANLLLSPSGRIEGKNLSAEEIEQKRKDVEQKEKEKKEKEKKKKEEEKYPKNSKS